MSNYAQSIVTILSLVNPAICLVMFAAATRGQTKRRKRANATWAMLAVAGILVGAALIGTNVLQAFGISLQAFQVAGGLVLGVMGGIILVGKSLGGGSSDESSGSGDSSGSIQPLILFAASPGTITGVITLSAAHTQTKVPWDTLAAIAIVIAITWTTLVLASRKTGHKKPGLGHAIANRLMGIIILAMGFQLALTGIFQFAQKQAGG